jgi:hypothetical protein
MTCRRCEQSLPESEFDPSFQHPERLKAFCRSCCKLFSDEAKAHLRKKHRRRRKSRRPKEREPRRGYSYADRNALLKELGYSSYAEYLKGELWQAIRAKVFAVKGTDCFLCGMRANQVHHNRYSKDALLGLSTKHLKPVCGVCHEDIEFNGQSKNTLSRAKMAFNRKRKEHNANIKAMKDVATDPLSEEYRRIIG